MITTGVKSAGSEPVSDEIGFDGLVGLLLRAGGDYKVVFLRTGQRFESFVIEALIAAGDEGNGLGSLDNRLIVKMNLDLACNVDVFAGCYRGFIYPIATFPICPATRQI